MEKYLEKGRGLISSLNDEVSALRLSKAKKGEFSYLDVVKSAYTKCYDFAYWNFSCTEYENAFFRIPVLRGVSEDLVVLTYLLTFEDNKRLEYLKYQMEYDTIKSLVNQKKFLNRHNPKQITIDPHSIIGEKRVNFILERPTNKNKAVDLGHKLLPSIYKMAKETGYEELYKYLYYATSKAVHFNPDNLLKLGWGNIDEDGNIKATFSYKHYQNYYLAFSSFYSIFLFVEQSNKFRNTLVLSNSYIETVSEIEIWLKSGDWPEITTFAQMNLKLPSLWDKVMHNIANNLNDE